MLDGRGDMASYCAWFLLLGQEGLNLRYAYAVIKGEEPDETHLHFKGDKLDESIESNQASIAPKHQA